MSSTELIMPTAPNMRQVLGRFCTGVTVIAGHDGERPHGFTCQSLASVSLTPPYVSFCPAHTSTSWPSIRSVGRFCINVLAEDQHGVCTKFATTGGDKFSDVDWVPARNGAPIIMGALVSIEADLEFEHGAGDHSIVVARVTALHTHPGSRPLLFFGGELGGFTGLGSAKR